MTCKHCGQPVTACRETRCPFYDCHGWLHTRDQQHTCNDMQHSATPEPGKLPVTEAPTSKPAGEVA